MNNETKQIINLIRKELKQIESPLPMYNMSYWKGYCNAVEHLKSYPHNSLWEIVKIDANQLMHNLRIKSKNPLVHLVSFK